MIFEATPALFKESVSSFPLYPLPHGRDRGEADRFGLRTSFHKKVGMLPVKKM